MTNRELDCWIAEHVFGVVDNTFAGTNYIEHRSNIEHYSTDAAADYLVLEAVRKDAKNSPWKLDPVQFSVSLRKILLSRGGEYMDEWTNGLREYGFYQPGDYSRAYAAACGVEV